MRSFDERQKGHEAQFAHGQELAFRITARRNRLLGVWAAGRLGLAAGEETEAYVKAVIAADFQAPGDDDVIEKVRGDLVAKGLDVTEEEVRDRIGASCRAGPRAASGGDEARGGFEQLSAAVRRRRIKRSPKTLTDTR